MGTIILSTKAFYQLEQLERELLDKEGLTPEEATLLQKVKNEKSYRLAEMDKLPIGIPLTDEQMLFYGIDYEDCPGFLPDLW